MKRALWMKAMTVAACSLALFAFASIARAQVVGPMSEEEYFPDMMQKFPDCNTAYNEFLTIAKPLKACQDLDDVKDNIAVKQEVVKEMGNIKGCKDCKKRAEAAGLDASNFTAQADTLSKQCPDKKEQYRLVSLLPDKHKEVCKSCKNKWPGKIGPYGISPCK